MMRVKNQPRKRECRAPREESQSWRDWDEVDGVNQEAGSVWDVRLKG